MDRGELPSEGVLGRATVRLGREHRVAVSASGTQVVRGMGSGQDRDHL